jgi:hypothetical protein
MSMTARQSIIVRLTVAAAAVLLTLSASAGASGVPLQ